MIEVIKKLKENEAVAKIKETYGISDSIDSLDSILASHTREDIQQAVNAAKSDLASKKSFGDFGYDYYQAFRYITEHGETPVLTEADKEGILTRSDEQIDSLDKLVLVHKTKYPPKGSKIETASDAYERGAAKLDTLTIGENSYEYVPMSAKPGRKTVHFSVNGAVSNHSYGSDWESMPYAIFMPFEDIPAAQIAQAASMDTYTYDAVDLTENTIVSCPEGEEEKVWQDNPILKRENVVPYRGLKVDGYENFIISNIMGCKPKDVGMWNWVEENTNDQKLYDKLMEEKGFSIMPHSGTKEAMEEQARSAAITMYSIIDVLRREKVCNSADDIEFFIENIVKQKVSYTYTAIQKETSLKILREDLNKRLNKANFPNLDTYTTEELIALGVPMGEGNLSSSYATDIFRQSFPDIYKPLMDSKKDEIKKGVASFVCDEFNVVATEYGDYVPQYVEANYCDSGKIEPINKPLEEMSLIDYISLSKKGYATKIYTVATDPELQNVCNQIFRSQGVPLTFSYDEKYKTMDPTAVVREFSNKYITALVESQKKALAEEENKGTQY